MWPFNISRNNLAANGKPVFIGGDGRSGTTLLSLILDSNSKLAIGPELHFMGPRNLGDDVLRAAQLLEVDDPKTRNPELRNHPNLKKPVQFAKRCRRYGVEFATLVNLVREAKGETGSNLASFEERCMLIDKVGESRRRATEKGEWGIKIMREISSADKYAAAWPGARFIHIIRDGRDVAASQMTEHKGWGYKDIDAAAKAWINVIDRARGSAKDLRYMEVKYEELVATPESVIPAMCGFLGVEFEEGMLDHCASRHSLFENPYNHPSYRGVSQPINETSVGRYKADLSRSQIDRFNRIAGARLEELGYGLS